MFQAKRKPTTVGDMLLEEFLIPYGLKINNLAEMLDVHRNTASAIVNNNSKLSLDMAIKLAKVFGTSVELWLNLQRNVDLWELENDNRYQKSLSNVKTVEEYLEEKEAA